MKPLRSLFFSTAAIVGLACSPVKRLANGTVDSSGRVAMCQACHSAQAANDYLYTGSIGQ